APTRLVAAWPSVKQRTEVSTPASWASMRAPPKPKHSSSGWAVTQRSLSLEVSVIGTSRVTQGAMHRGSMSIASCFEFGVFEQQVVGQRLAGQSVVEEQACDFGFAGDEGADGREGAAVERAGAEGDERAAMLGRSVTLVRGEAVAGMDYVEFAHQAIAMHFGDHRSGGYGKGEGVTVEEAGLGTGVVETHRVDEQVIGRKREAMHRG